LSILDKSLLKNIITLLVQNEELDERYKDHKLTGNFKYLRECHIKPDLLLIYKKDDGILELSLVHVGNHGSLFK